MKSSKIETKKNTSDQNQPKENINNSLNLNNNMDKILNSVPSHLRNEAYDIANSLNPQDIQNFQNDPTNFDIKKIRSNFIQQKNKIKGLNSKNADNRTVLFIDTNRKIKERNIELNMFEKSIQTILKSDDISESRLDDKFCTIDLKNHDLKIFYSDKNNSKNKRVSKIFKTQITGPVIMSADIDLSLDLFKSLERLN